MKLKTSAKDFKTFQRWVKTYIKLFGLLQYKICFSHKDDMDGSLAEFEINEEQTLVCFSLNKDWSPNDEVTEAELHRVALHETLHLLLSNLCHQAYDRYSITSTSIDSAEHAIIYRLENCLLGGTNGIA
jgi:hypothetical protein